MATDPRMIEPENTNPDTPTPERPQQGLATALRDIARDHKDVLTFKEQIVLDTAADALQALYPS